MHYQRRFYSSKGVRIRPCAKGTNSPAAAPSRDGGETRGRCATMEKKKALSVSPHRLDTTLDDTPRCRSCGLEHRVLEFVGQRHLAAPGLQCAGMPCGKKLRSQDSGASPLSLPYTLCSLINLLSDLFSLLSSLSSRLSSLMISAFFPLLSSLSALFPLLSLLLISQIALSTCHFELCI